MDRKSQRTRKMKVPRLLRHQQRHQQEPQRERHTRSRAAEQQTPSQQPQRITAAACAKHDMPPLALHAAHHESCPGPFRMPRQPTRQPSLTFAPSLPQAATATASRTTRNAARQNVSTDRKRRKPRTSAPGQCTRSSALDTASQVACACGAVTRRSWHGGAGTAERYACCRCRASARAGRRQSG